MNLENNKEIQKVIKNKRLAERNKETKEQIEENVIEWTTFYRRNLDIFTEDYLEIPIHAFQKQLLLDLQENDVTDVMASRGLGKSIVVGIFAIDMALLYSNCYILITSFTLTQSNEVIEGKIDKKLSNLDSGISPVLQQLRRDKYMQIKKDENTGAKYVEFGNGSKIFAVNCGDSARSKRSNVVITDECVLIKKKDYQEIIEPTLEPRGFKGRPLDYKEETKQIFLSSAKNKGNWMWRHLKDCVNEHYKNKRIKYGFFAGDIFTAVASGIQTKNQYFQRKKTVDDMSFEQEYLNIFLGNSENSIFRFEDFERNQILEHPFYPRSVEDILYGVKNTYVFSDEWIRFLVCDIAVATGNENDNTVFLFMCFNKETGERKVEYIKTLSGLNSLKQTLLMKRMFIEYDCNYIVIDTKGVGNVIFDILTVETEDRELNVTYPAWTVCKDRLLQISSDGVMNDKIERTMSDNALEIIIPFAGTAEINSQMHYALRQSLKDNTISFLKDEGEMMAKIEDNDPNFMIKTSDERAEIRLPFTQTKYMINEAISLEAKFLEDGKLKVQEAKRTDVKDRYMTLAMGNIFADKLYAKYNKDSQQSDFNIDAWSFLSSL